jgi:hypothetical protein
MPKMIRVCTTFKSTKFMRTQQMIKGYISIEIINSW